MRGWRLSTRESRSEKTLGSVMRCVYESQSSKDDYEVLDSIMRELGRLFDDDWLNGIYDSRASDAWS